MCSLVFTIEVAGRGIQISVLASHIHERKGMTDEGPLEQTKSKLSHCLWQVFTHIREPTKRGYGVTYGTLPFSICSWRQIPFPAAY